MCSSVFEREARELCVIIRVLQQQQHSGTGGAYRLVPAMIYVTIKANPTRFASNLKYVRQYRDEKMMRGEEKYALVVAESAVRFLLQEEDEDEEEEDLFSEMQEQQEEEDEEDLVCTLLHSLVLHIQHTRETQLSTGTFREVQSAGDLRLDDIPKLLHEYKRLCKMLEKRLLKKKDGDDGGGDGDDGDGLLVGLLD